MYSRVCSSYRVKRLFGAYSNLNVHISQREASFLTVLRKRICDSSHKCASDLSCLSDRWIHSSISCLSSDSVAKLRSSQQDPNKFGTLTKESSSEDVEDEGDVAEDQYITYPVPQGQKLRIVNYAAIIKDHIEKKEILAAAKVVEIRMMKEDRVKPDSYIFSLVISACGKNGFMKKAFQLYRKMKDCGLKVPGAVYTALFNACATCSNPEDGLRQATQLRSKLIEKGVELNQTHYHVMVKAFGRCGDLVTAFQIVDVMVDKEIETTEETFNFLLHACITDKESGFRYALMVWHKMLQKKIKPSIFTFNLLLRTLRDCGVGTPEEIQSTLRQLVLDAGTLLEIEQGDGFQELTVAPNLLLQLPQGSTVTKSSAEDNFPDFLAQRPKLGNFAMSLDLTKPHHRLFLIGGSKRFIELMKYYKVHASLKTYSVLLDCIPPTVAAEKILLLAMEKNGLKIDTAFCNALIKRRSFRFDYASAQEVLCLMSRKKLMPDVITFGVLALGCKNIEESNDLMRDMKMAGYRANVEIFGAMLQNACIRHDFKYIMKILRLVQEEEIEFTEFLQNKVDKLIHSCKSIINQMPHQEEMPKSLQKKTFKKDFLIFFNKYRAWLKDITTNEEVPSSS